MTSVGRFLRRYLTRYLWWYAAGTVALAATNTLSVQVPLILAHGIDSLGAGDRSGVWGDVVEVALMGVGVFLFRSASRLLFFTPGRLVEAELKHDLFARLLRQQPPFLRRWPTGDLVSRTTSDVNMARLLAGFTALGLINTVVAVTVTGVQMVRISPILALASMVPVALGFLVTQASVRTLLASMALTQQQAADLSDHVLSSYQGVATVKAFDAAPAFQARFDKLSDDWLSSNLRRTNIRIGIGPVLSLAASTNVFLLLALGGPMAMRGEISVGELVAFTSLVGYLIGPLRGMSFILALFKQAEASLDRLEAVMTPEPDRPDLQRAGGPLPAPARPPAISVRGLTFSWPGATAPSLVDVGFDVGPGETLGLFGATGSGKSTLIACLARLENPAAGTVRVNGADLLDVDLDGWRRITTVVSQRPFLFSETVRDNILLGTPDDGRLAEICAACCLEPDLAQLPNGLDTVVGEAGVTLSGGQRQRVALARGLVRPHVVRLLDDVLSAVDAATEAALIQTLRSPAPDGTRPTTVLVSHRISALRHADRILVLDRGAVVDAGTHEELVHRPGPYRETWEHQSGDSA